MNALAEDQTLKFSPNLTVVPHAPVVAIKYKIATEKDAREWAGHGEDDFNSRDPDSLKRQQRVEAVRRRVQQLRAARQQILAAGILAVHRFVQVDRAAL